MIERNLQSLPLNLIRPVLDESILRNHRHARKLSNTIEVVTIHVRSEEMIIVLQQRARSHEEEHVRVVRSAGHQSEGVKPKVPLDTLCIVLTYYNLSMVERAGHFHNGVHEVGEERCVLVLSTGLEHRSEGVEATCDAYVATIGDVGDLSLCQYVGAHQGRRRL